MIIAVTTRPKNILYFPNFLKEMCAHACVHTLIHTHTLHQQEQQNNGDHIACVMIYTEPLALYINM